VAHLRRSGGARGWSRAYLGRMRTFLRLHGDLRPLARRDGTGDLHLTSVGPRSVKDLVESVGVPHTEVAHLTVDGAPVGFAHRLVGEECVEAFSAAEAPTSTPSVLPPDPPRAFACDVHLGTLARRLRLLGFDTWYANDVIDDDLLRRALDEDRVLLSRDRGLLCRRELVHGYLPRSDDPHRQLVEVVERFGLAADATPLTRCVRCNGRLHPVPLEEVATQVPPRSRRAFDRFARCRRCGQVFWPGSHLEALTDVLALGGGGRGARSRLASD
jgi:uncharacterized protein